MPEVPFKVSAVEVRRGPLWRPNAFGALIGIALSLSAGGCADQVAQYQPPLFVNSGAPVAPVVSDVVTGSATVDVTAAGAADVSEDAAAQDWTKRTYVYRGGRDPKTGLARTQL
jgi:hypothetical protein